MNTRNFTKVLFWLAFLAFLATSIPHVAWLYHVYEPQDNILWWILSYAIAVGIDVLIAWLSFTQTNSKKVATGIIWLFIATLCALSWYANYMYSMEHNPVVMHDVWSINIAFGVTTGYITPIIVSALPVFVIAYTFMLSIVNNASRESLLEKVTRVEQERELRARLIEAKQGGLSSRIKRAIDDTTDIASHARNSVKKASKRQERALEPEEAISLPPQDTQPLEPLLETVPQPEHVSLVVDDKVSSLEGQERALEVQGIPLHSLRLAPLRNGLEAQIEGTTDTLPIPVKTNGHNIDLDKFAASQFKKRR